MEFDDECERHGDKKSAAETNLIAILADFVEPRRQRAVMAGLTTHPSAVPFAGQIHRLGGVRFCDLSSEQAENRQHGNEQDAARHRISSSEGEKSERARRKCVPRLQTSYRRRRLSIFAKSPRLSEP